MAKSEVGKEPLSPAARRRLEALVKELGEGAAASSLRVSPHTLARALAGLDLRRGTALLIEQGLGEGART